MGTPHPPGRVLFFTGLLYRDRDAFERARDMLERTLGAVAMEGPEIPWDFSDYYCAEMGSPLRRRFLFFERLLDPECLPGVKLITNGIEETLSVESRRTVNVDPGYITPAKVVLASTKDFAHRVYLREGIYAEVTLLYLKGSFIPHLNTYPDYRDGQTVALFGYARNLPASLQDKTEAPDPQGTDKNLR